ncbi:hypothetical protein D1B31_14065 [Neobacillus notoginsengisoli]|uniref:Uncharacterized protein n=1 Tax=Neobacillus notoginsengisoli TaxID=1578198 RepID=A0A417YSX1_9BACI|nr:hypothetical protein [Neobacillus notoginsengisoli]RHW39079.1 hypothetical protein D1B31_14065 [Neobacillus notoginsengisoli]
MLLQTEIERVNQITKEMEVTLPSAFHTFQAEDLLSIYKSLANVQTVVGASNDKISPFIYREKTEDLSREQLENAVASLLTQVILAGAKTDFAIDEARWYRTSDFADAMGVTLATVSNWIKDGRLIGVEKKGKGKHAQIPETATYFSVTREKFKVQEIMENFYKTINNYNELPAADENEEYERINAHFIKKYKGTFEETLGIKEQLDRQEARDRAEWEFVLKEMGKLDG